LWILRSGARWQDLPEEFPSPATCWRRLRDWEEQGAWLKIWRAFLAELNQRKQLAVERVFPGREFCSRQKRGAGVGKTKRGKGTKWMVVVDGQGLPLGNYLCSASPHEARLAETTLASIRISRRAHAGWPRQKPLRLIADRGYDSDPLRERLAERGIELIAPHRWNRSNPVTQDGRALRRYRRRWKVERTFAWLGNFRHLVVRCDRSLTIYSAFFHIACFMIVLRRVLK
jgi:transposase